MKRGAQCAVAVRTRSSPARSAWPVAPTSTSRGPAIVCSSFPPAPRPCQGAGRGRGSPGGAFGEAGAGVEQAPAQHHQAVADHLAQRVAPGPGAPAAPPAPRQAALVGLVVELVDVLLGD